MLIFDYSCSACQTIEERMVGAWNEPQTCKCGAPMNKVFVSSGGARLPDDTEWLKSIPEVVSKTSTDPVDIEMRRNPTRENLRRWMKHHDYRHLEDGETSHRKDIDVDRMTDRLLRQHMERNRIEVRG